MTITYLPGALRPEPELTSQLRRLALFANMTAADLTAELSALHPSDEQHPELCRHIDAALQLAAAIRAAVTIWKDDAELLRSWLRASRQELLDIRTRAGLAPIEAQR